MAPVTVGKNATIGAGSTITKDVEDGGDQLFYIHFKKPNDVRNMTFLVNKHPDRDDDRWLFIPSIKMVKRIAASDARAAFVGSDYTYEDISGRHPNNDNTELVGEEDLDAALVSGASIALFDSGEEISEHCQGGSRSRDHERLGNGVTVGKGWILYLMFKNKAPIMHRGMVNSVNLGG